MDRDPKKWLAIISIAVAATVILFLLLFGFDLSGFEIHRGIRINLNSSLMGS